MSEMERILYEAAVEGSVPSLLRLLQQDQLVLHRFVSGCFTETPLHIAAMLGHLEFAKEILARLPHMAGERDSARKSSPLHLASANGHLEIVKELLLANPEMCLAKDCEGRNPLHIAVIKGHTEVLKELVRANPRAARTHAGTGTILHLCVKHHQLEALEYLVGMMAGDREFINSKDHNGSTILHLAAENRQQEIFEFLRSNTTIDVDSRNTAGFSAFDIERQGKIPEKCKENREENPPARSDEDDPLYSTAERGSSSSSKWNPNNPQPQESGTRKRPWKKSAKKSTKKTPPSWLERKKQALMVVAGLIATVTFQAGITPPGGLWQDTTEDSPSQDSSAPSPSQGFPHKAGFSIMADNNPVIYYRFLVCNSMSLFASMSIILLLVSGLPMRHRLFMWILMVIVWVAITTMAITYLFSIVIFTPDAETGNANKVLVITVLFWLGLMALLLLGQTIRFIVRIVRKIKKFPFGTIHQYIFRSSSR